MAQKSPYRYRVMARQRWVEHNPMFTYDDAGRREYGSGLTLGEARNLVGGFNPGMVIEENVGSLNGMPLWREV